MFHHRRSLKTRLANLTAPIFIETLLIMLLGAVDTIMLSQYSDNTVAAVGVVNQLLNLVFLIFGVTTAGTSVLCSQYLGAGQHKNMLQVVGLSILFNTAIGLVCSAFLFFGAHGMLSLMELRPELINDGLSYMEIVGGGAFLQAISLTLSAVLRSANKAYYPMVVTLIINIVNIFGNYALIFGKFGFPQMGVEGAAISTTVSRTVAMLLLFGILFAKLIRRIPLSYFKPFPVDKFKNLMAIGLPSAGEQISYSFSQVVITYFINMLGNEALTARTYAMNIIMFTYLFSMSLGQGGGICIGHLIGEHKNRAALILGRYCLKWSIIISIGMAVFSAAMGKTIVGLLTSNPEIIRMTVTVLMIDIVLELGRAVNIFCVYALRSAGNANYPFIVGLIVMWSCAVGGSYLFGITLGWGLAGMWWAFTLDENIRAVILSRRWNSRKWERYSFVK